MPKRRLGYGEVPTETKMPSVSQRRRSPSAPTAEEPAVSSRRTSSSRRQSSGYLLKLSQSCNSHASKCPKDRSTTTSADDQDERIPDLCRADLEQLRNLLPEIEKKFQPPAPGQRGPEADDVAHLCDFYNSVIQGHYCPFMPHLFRLGKSPKDVIGRVHFLFRHVITPAVIATAKEEPVCGDSSAPENSQPILRTISLTIAHLLSFLFGSSIRSSVLLDLVNLLEDCSFLFEDRILPVKLSLFTETCESSSLDVDCCLDISQWDQLWTLQTATLMALSAFMADIRAKTLQPQSTMTPESTDPTSIPSGWVDLEVWIPHHLCRGEMISSLVSAIRSIVLLETCPRVSRTLFFQGKVAAAAMLKQLVSDWSRIAPSTCSFVDYSMLVVQAIKASTRNGPDQPTLEYLSLLGELLRRAVMEPPIIAGRSFSTGAPCSLEMQLLPLLLDCVPTIDKKDVESRNYVDAMVLTTISMLLHEGGSKKKAVSYSLSNGIIPPLLGLTRDPRLSNHASAILLVLFREMTVPNEINSIFHAAMEAHKKGKAGYDSRSSSTNETNKDTAFIGSKRKRESTKSSSESHTFTCRLELLPSKTSGGESSLTEGRQVAFQSWRVALRSALEKGMDAAARLVENISYCGSMLKEQSHLDDAHTVAGTLSLVSRTIAQFLALNVNSDSISSIADVHQRLIEAIEGACNILSFIPLDSVGESDYVLHRLVIDSALHLHYSLGVHLLEPQHAHIRKMLEMLISSSNLARKLIMEDHASVTPPIHSLYAYNFGSSTKLVEALFLRVPKMQPCGEDSLFSWRISFFRRFESSQVLQGSVFVPVASLELVSTLSLGARCSLLSSLYPEGCALTTTLRLSEGPCETRSLSKALLVQEPKDQAILPLLFLPLYLSSLALAASDAVHHRFFFDFFLQVLVDIMIPLSNTARISNTAFCRALLFAAGKIQSLATLPIVPVAAASPRFDAFVTFKDLSTVNFASTFESGEEVPNLQLDIQVKRFVYMLFKKIPEDHPDDVVRRLRWICMAKLVSRSSTTEIREHVLVTTDSVAVDTPTSGEQTSNLRSQSLFLWLLEAPFLDDNHRFREETSRALWHLLLSRNDSFLLAHFCSEENIQTLTAYSWSSNTGRSSTQQWYEVEDAAANVVSEFFRYIDKLLHSSIGVADSQLSSTLANSGSGQATRKNHKTNKWSTETTTVKLLASFCRHADTRTPIGKFFSEKAFQRLVRIWAAAAIDGTDVLSFSSNKALAFAELSRIAGHQIDGRCLFWQQSAQLTAIIFSDILVLTGNARMETQFLQLDGFFRAIITNTLNGPLVNTRTLQAVLSFIDDTLPAIIAHFIEEKSMDLLRLTPAFRQFIDERIRRARRNPTGEPILIGASNEPDKWKYSCMNSTTDNLEAQGIKLCLDNKILDRVLPLILMRMDRTGLSYFVKEVLKGTTTLRDLIKNRDQMILKGLVWELGREPGGVGPARIAIRAAAAMRTIDKISSSETESHRSASAEVEAGNCWVTSHFMFLLVSVVQSRWKARTLVDRLHAVRCLHGLLDFLVAEEAPQYFPQIMGTVNASILDGDEGNWASDEDRANASSLRLYAVKSLSKFIRLVADVQLENIALNLTTVVVALLPVVDEHDNDCIFRSGWVEAREVAISLLEFLTAGELGRSLAENFKEIPFLPASQLLENVHQSLRVNGVDFDNLAVLSSTSQHRASAGREISTAATDMSATMGSVPSQDSEKVLALQKRLSLICSLLENEIPSVRKIALQHLTDLLRGNRRTFHTLVRNESSLSGKRFLTVTYTDDTGNPRWTSRGAATAMMERLLARCVGESDDEVRLRLAACLGEVGAISETILGEISIGSSMGDEAIDAPTSSYKWRLEQPPWRSQDVKYELHLVTRHLVVALKATPSSTDQHKIAFAIQQLLNLLNSSGIQNESVAQDERTTVGQVTMTKWLKETLEQSGQYDLIEPYFSSDFKEKSSEAYSAKKPPFVKISAGYHAWVSNFCRWMIEGSKHSDLSPWKDFFFACRTAIRTEAGLNVAEFIFPLLVLDRICFATSSEDHLLLRQELSDVLHVDTIVFMDVSDRQRAVNVVFTTIDTLKVWAEREIEDRSRGRSSTATSTKGRHHVSSKPLAESSSRNWPVEESIEKITALLKSVSLNLQAQAAHAFGMNARALQRLEQQAREDTTISIFEKSAQEQKKDALKEEKTTIRTFGIPDVESFNIELMKNVLSRLDDCETMAAIRKDTLFFNPLQQIKDNIREKEASNYYESALQEYERALQANTSQDCDQNLVRGSLRCLMELGRYESVLHHVAGLQQNMDRDGSLVVQEVSAFAVEAAWKLGRWRTLSEVLEEKVNTSNTTHSDAYQIFTGKAMLGLHRHDPLAVDSAICCARESVMQNLSCAARESYARSYDEIVRLQSLRELENANGIFSIDDHSRFDLDEIANSLEMDGWSWKGRVDIVTSHAALSIIGTRVALARLYSDPVLVGSLFLDSGHRARKNQRWTIAENLLSQARAAVSDLKGDQIAGNLKLFHLVYSSQVQVAKHKYASGECAVALKILGQHTVDRAISQMLPNIEKPDFLAKLATTCEKRLIGEFAGMSAADYEDDQKLTKRFAGRLLQLTRWVSESGLQGGSEVMGRFQLIQKLAPEWEKGQFHFGKFIDKNLQTRVTAMASGLAGNGIDDNEVRNNIILRDHVYQTHTLLAMHRYASALKMDTKHVYHALPRLLSLWFDLVSVGREQPEPSSKQDPLYLLRQHQNQANTFMASQIRDIPSVAFYTAMPQLISRIIHDDPETSLVVKSILQRVLTKFPQQAMWPLAWLKGSKIEDREKIGEEVFNGAQKTLSKHHKGMSNLIKVSGSLFEFLRALAAHEGSSDRPHSNLLTIRPWQSVEVDLCEFFPPIQAALAMTPTSTDQLYSKDHCPRSIPRMRAFSSRVSVMTSKAKPKKLRAYAVPGSYRPPSPLQKAAIAKSRSKEEVDIGELHFLVKQEAKGDLRKDARVQDLNNVINRLMASNNEGSGASSGRRRRLHLRTFAVTCLSEDVGILEWVPDTDSLRNLVSRSYNPQTSANCPRRRGNRLTNFADATLRSHYEMCQNKYFKEGNLAKAATLFEDHCLRPYPPLLYWWFVQKFHDPHAWYEARNRFTLSAAAWSAVGHVIGLGDRHSENILVDTSNGECVHVDFDCIFDKGLNLPRPEVVPFRLTANMLDAFGPTGADGIYTAGLQTAMRTLRDNRDTLLSVLEPFLKDPVIDWKRHRGQQKNSSGGTSVAIHTDRQTKEAKRSIQVIDERLQGIYNLRNPNLKKYKRKDRPADQDDEFSHLVPLPVEGQVQRMIEEATSHENLVQLYVGWMPWV